MNTDVKTKQGLFNVVATHLLKQRCRSSAPSGLCLYRGPNDTKCAAGAVLPDDRYFPFFEGKSVYDSSTRHVFADIVGEGNMNLLGELQDLHDSGGDWTLGLKSLAHGADLTVEAVTSECYVDRL